MWGKNCELLIDYEYWYILDNEIFIQDCAFTTELPLYHKELSQTSVKSGQTCMYLTPEVKILPKYYHILGKIHKKNVILF